MYFCEFPLAYCWDTVVLIVLVGWTREYYCFVFPLALTRMVCVFIGGGRYGDELRRVKSVLTYFQEGIESQAIDRCNRFVMRQPYWSL